MSGKVWNESELKFGRKHNVNKWNTISLEERHRLEALRIIDQFGYIQKNCPYTGTRM